MPQPRQHASRSRVFVLALAGLIALALTGVAGAEFPYMNTGPSITGTPQEGQTLNGHNGLWLYTNGLKCESNECKYTYTWQRCNPDVSGCADIPGATGFTYLLTAEDVGKRIRFVEWVFKHDCGEWNYQLGTQECHDVTRNGVSSPTEVVAPKPVIAPQSATPPTLSGVAMEDEVLRARGGTWNGQQPIAVRFQWQRCNAQGQSCGEIAGATAATYRLTSADVGSRIRVAEVASNAGGSATAVSAPTVVVIELRPTAARQTIAASRVTLPHRLVLDKMVARRSGDRVVASFRVSDDRGFRVTGVIVRVVVAPSGTTARRTSDSDGWATFTFPVAGGRGTLYFYVEAWRKGEGPQAGVATATLFRYRVGG